MDLFVFLRMGGSHDRIEIDLIAHPDHDKSAARRELKAKLASFDAEKAECFLEKDRQRLLAVVEAGFGNFEAFNTTMRSIFDERVRRDDVVASSASSATAKVAPASPALGA